MRHGCCGTVEPDSDLASRFAFLRFHPRLLSRRYWRTRLVFWGGAVAVGLVSVVFAKAANTAQDFFQHILINPWLALALTPLGFMLSAWLARAVFPGAQGSGIPQAIAARTSNDPTLRERLLSLRLAFGKILLTLLGLASGASIGREGPTVQVGAAIMLATARVGGPGLEKGLILAGSAAGVAAAFNTPLAGIVFAIEEMSREYEQRTSGLVLISVILAGLASLGLVGNYDYFGSSSAMLRVTIDWLAPLFCGVICGIAGALFARLIIAGTIRIKSWISPSPMTRTLLLAGLCGLIVAICGLLSSGMTYGTGYGAARLAVEGHHLPFSFAPLKFIATAASSLSGIPGGLFAPSLSVGAGAGEMIGTWLGVHSVGAVVLLGMAGYFAGVTQAPITAFVIINEMTDSRGMVIPLMIAAFIGYGVSRLLQHESLYHALAKGFVRDMEGRETAG
jgi:H+/Cl- antiporter ClcA